MYDFLINKPVRVYDATKKPPERHARKLEVWKRSNYEGVIVEASAAHDGNTKLTIRYKAGPIAVFHRAYSSVQATGHGKYWDGVRNFDVDLSAGAE